MNTVARARMPRRTIEADFLFGVGDSGFQSEGGYNGAGQPANNWAAWERSGRATPAGAASEFWTRYPEHFDRAVETGCNAFRLGVEWTRCVPQRDQIDFAAIDHYCHILEACRARGLEPIVALHHFTHPAWLGPDFWLHEEAPRQFAHWVELIVPRLAPHCRRWITINEINAYAIGTYLIGYFPPGHRFRRKMAARAMSNMLAGHVLAYDAIHRRQPDAEVGTSTYAFWSYDVDRLPIDLLLSRSLGINRVDLDEWLVARRKRYSRCVLENTSGPRRLVESAIHRGLQLYMPGMEGFSTAIDHIERAETAELLDVIQLNYYDPILSNYCRMPGRRLSSGIDNSLSMRCKRLWWGWGPAAMGERGRRPCVGGVAPDAVRKLSGGKRRWMPDPKHWEQRPSPEHLVSYLRANQQPGLPIWILENGLCNPVSDGVALARPDGWTRPRYLTEHLSALQQALDAGIDVRAYVHWCLFDSYQWGEYESRFGLCGVKRDDGDCKLLESDSMGQDSAGAYREHISMMRAGGKLSRTLRS